MDLPLFETMCIIRFVGVEYYHKSCFFCWNISVIFSRDILVTETFRSFISVVLKLATKEFVTYIFKHFDRNDNFFRAFQRFGLWPKTNSIQGVSYLHANETKILY